MITLLLLLAMLQVKHWYIDFVNQSMDEVNHKGIYGDWTGIKHSVKHGVATWAIMPLFFGIEVGLGFGFILGFLDFILHYHIDWAKMNWGNRDIQTPAFWSHLGLDQMAHQLVYLVLIGLIII
jgi:hypothetical protein